MRARTAAKRLGDAQYETYLDATIFSLSDIYYTREEAAKVIGPSLTAVSRLDRVLRAQGVRSSTDLDRLGIDDLAATPGVGMRQLEVACCVLDEAGKDVMAWIKGWNGSKAAVSRAVKRGSKRKKGTRTYRQGKQ